MLPEQDGGVDRPRPCPVRRMQPDVELGETGLLEMESRLVQIHLPLGDVLGEVLLPPADGMVVAEIAVTAQDGVQKRVAVDRVLERKTNVIVVEGR